MEKENKLINLEDEGLGKNYLFLGRKDKRDLVMAPDSNDFMVVDEFSEDAVAMNDGAYQEIDEEDDGFIYAEEIFDDDDDIYANNIRDTKIKKARRRTFAQIGADINTHLTKHGFTSETFGHNLLSSMFYSRIINAQAGYKLEDKVIALLQTFKCQRNVIDKFNDENIAHNNTFLNAISAAKGNTNKPVFIYLKGISVKDLFNYVKPLYAYIDNPLGDSYINANGASIKMPANVWIIFTTPEHEELFNIARRLLRFVSILPVEMEECRPSQIKEELTISREELKATLNETNENRVLLEDSWKKIDSLASLIGTVNGYEVQNKIALRIEDFCSTLFCLENLQEDDIIDIALARNVITEALITNTPEEYLQNVNLFNEIDNSFGLGKLPLTRKIIENYMEFAIKGGN